MEDNKITTEEQKPENSPETKSEDKQLKAKNLIAIIALCTGLAIIVAMLVVALILGKPVYDKVAVLWIIALGCGIVVNRSNPITKSFIVFVSATSLCAVLFTVLYFLGLAGIIA